MQLLEIPRKFTAAWTKRHKLNPQMLNKSVCVTKIKTTVTSYSYPSLRVSVSAPCIVIIIYMKGVAEAERHFLFGNSSSDRCWAWQKDSNKGDDISALSSCNSRLHRASKSARATNSRLGSEACAEAAPLMWPRRNQFSPWLLGRYYKYGAIHKITESEPCIVLGARAQDHAWDIGNRIEPAHCPKGKPYGGTSRERKCLRHTILFFFLWACALTLAWLWHSGY